MGMFHFDPEYPPSVDEALTPPVKFKSGTIKAMIEFRQSRPWSGTGDERIAKFTTLVNELSRVYGIEPPVLDTAFIDPDRSSDRSFYVPAMHMISLRGRLSVITLLHELAHALGKNEYDACRWSLCLFRRVFPRQWDRLSFDGHVARGPRQ